MTEKTTLLDIFIYFSKRLFILHNKKNAYSDHVIVYPPNVGHLSFQMNATRGTGTVYPSGAPELTAGF